MDSLAVGSHQLLDPIRPCTELGGCAVDDQDRTSDARIEVEHVKGIGLRQDLISEPSHLRPDACVTGLREKTALSRFDQDSVGYSNTRRQRSLLGKQRIHLGCLERPDERVQGLLNDSVNLLLALPSVHWVKPDILIGSLPAVAVQVDDAPRIRMVAAPHDREHPAEGVTGNRRVDQLQVLPDDAYIAQRICP